MTTAISVSDLSVAYKLYSKPSDILREALFGGRRHDTFWALRDVSLTIAEGERVGIIGPNGAGKSTLLKVIAGNLTPTSGRVSVHGKISSLLSMVPAWNEEMSGIENARFNLAMQGASDRQIGTMLEDIADFTELGAFLSRPVKTYSTGMGARLSFAIATALDPEILIIDEVLGTGDGYFAAKAAARMKKFCERGRALLFVSHSTHHVRTMCQRCIWIENGNVRLSGPAETVVRQYEEDMLRKDEAANREGNKARIEKSLHLVSPEDLKVDDLWCIRVRPMNDLHLSQTHYIKDIGVAIDGAKFDVPLEILDIRRPDVAAALDTLSCEWGRMFDRLGEPSRILSSKIGVRKGGYILVRRAPGSSGPVSIQCSFEHSCADGDEQLTADVLNIADGEWSRLDLRAREKQKDGWQRVVVGGKVQVPSETAHRALVERSTEEHRLPVEIVSVTVRAASGALFHLRENEPFKIQVALKRNEPVDTLNASINIFRSDGVYVFYQASCFDRTLGAADEVDLVEFEFDPNPLGAGEYEINTFVTNSFSAETGPPSDIYDKRIGERFTVALNRPFAGGLVNVKVPVSFSAKDQVASEREMQ
ncbi:MULTISPECIES: ABC transporter ATP-binding protein [Bradyrhizobium]|uniref:ABC transporter ATP-binding protein n=1 Tax=Bradyrhizobium TaxID=374 RepID=UPI001EDB9685|nr:ABC transporter ATP-binding protein [Bradyrhizobium zhengyangense]MCG2643562.1 ABC transporter ATP-binding protein [Bradyrhizobium zhengyangense]